MSEIYVITIQSSSISCNIYIYDLYNNNNNNDNNDNNNKNNLS